MRSMHDIFEPEDEGTIDAFLAATVEPDDIVTEYDDGQGTTRFRIDTKSGASWVMRKLAGVRAKKAENGEIAETQIAALRAWLEHENKQLDRDDDRLVELLRDWHCRTIVDEIGVHPLHGPVEPAVWDKLRKKSVSLPSGKVNARRSAGKFERTDEDAALAALGIVAPALVKIERSVAATPFDDAMKTADPPVRTRTIGEISYFQVRVATQKIGAQEAVAIIDAQRDPEQQTHTLAVIVGFGLDALGEVLDKLVADGVFEQSVWELVVTQQLGQEAQAELWVEIPGVCRSGVDVVTITATC